MAKFRNVLGTILSSIALDVALRKARQANLLHLPKVPTEAPKKYFYYSGHRRPKRTIRISVEEMIYVSIRMVYVQADKVLCLRPRNNYYYSGRQRLARN